jgi:hypothetical protein
MHGDAPFFVLDPCLQDGKKIPKWNRQARLAQLVGFSPEHSFHVANVQHLLTNHISFQFHLIHYDNIETILNNTPLDHQLSDQRLQEIFDTSREVYADIDHSDNDAIVYAPPPLDDIWLDERECHAKKLELAKEHAQACDRWRFEAKPPPVSVPTMSPTPVSTVHPHCSDGPVVSNDNSSESSNSSYKDSLVYAAPNDPFIAEVQCRYQRLRQDEGFLLGGQCQSKRLRQGRNPRPLYPLTGKVLRLSLLTN